MNMISEVCREIIVRLMSSSSLARDEVTRVKAEVCRVYGFQKLPSNSNLIKHLKPEEAEKLLPILRRKAVREISGVAVVAVMTKPWPCPHGKCAYCPGGPSYGVPQSYTGHEPAAMRGLQAQFNPYTQVKARISQLQAIGHEVDKVELIIMGGTFPAMPVDYQESFVKECLDAMNGAPSLNLSEAKKLAEVSDIRNVGITVETRPDWAKQTHVDRMLSLGVTRVELGVQNLYDDVYKLVERGHTVQDVVDSTRILKDSGLKVCYHMMPGLPGSSFNKDLEAFKKVFTDPNFKPDMIKIYPCLVLEGTKVYEWLLKSEYKPYTTEEAAELIAEVKGLIPPWVRVMRIQRDIPAKLIAAGVKKSNLRQLVLLKLKERGGKCRCIRCREVGHRMMKDNVKPNPDSVKILSQKYEASEGYEIFISAEDPLNDVLIGYLRLRIPSEKAHRPEIAGRNASIIRELHVYGPRVPVGKRMAEAWQHKGYGGILLSEAERISVEEYGRRKILVMSALGTKQYYMRFNYMYDGPYMSKTVNKTTLKTLPT